VTAPIRFLKLTSITIAELPTMVLSETRGLWLSSVVRGGIGSYRRLSVFEVHSGLNVSVDTLPRSRASQEANWPTVKDDDPQDGTDSLPEALKLLVVSNVGGRSR
jgi:hypothetical protein